MDPIEPVFTFKLKELFENDTLAEVFEKYVELFNVPLRLFDDTDSLLLEQKLENPVCQYLNTNSQARNSCMVIRQKVKAASPDIGDEKFKKINCFCGLEYILFPVIFQSAILGKLIMGPFFPKQLEKIPDSLSKVFSEFDPVTFKTALSQLPRYSYNHIYKIGQTILTSLNCIFFAAHESNVTSQMHTALIRESYREIFEKNKRLEEITDERKEFDRRKSNFLAMVSHELRTPLTSIIGYSDMLAEGIGGELGDEQKQFVQTIKSKGDELLKLISSILDFSKIDSGRLSTNLIPANVADLVHEALKYNTQLARRRGIKVTTRLEEGLPIVQLDPEKIVTAISHLVDNAIKFSFPGGLIHIHSHVVASNEEDVSEDGIGFVLMAAPDMLEIAVEDFGTGIETDDIDSIFAPFTQADESSTREHGGSGLGLAIVKQYVEAHGGRVLVSTKKGKGSRFAIRIPIVETTL